MNNYVCLNIQSFINNRGATSSNNYQQGELSLGKSSLPEEEFPKDLRFTFNNVPFQFYRSEQGDNIEMEGQTLEFSPLSASKVHFLGVSSNGDMFDNIYFLNNTEVIHTGKLYLSDFVSELPAFQDQCALCFSYLNTRGGKRDHIKPKLWYSYIELPQLKTINKIRLEDNPFIHIFAITFES
ncbi:hypothetical protein [Brevibacillus laterosporus]|uniref:Uncharacterized protein n=1 Tax=Brevibacillus laterosporus TaxID=1465 RepID=A0A0F7EJZ0_BRELA|nr:hypothetical protein [Brevibacillus laterosporus]AKF95959.1 hypothetical protein EX87_20500 [Brevibacillus laterosporus]